MSSSSSASNADRFEASPPPMKGQIFIDREGAYWEVRRLTTAETLPDFYLVHLSYGPSLDKLEPCLVVGPREFAALVRDRNLQTHLHSA
jgi:hypothetical protein